MTYLLNLGHFHHSELGVSEPSECLLLFQQL